MRQTSQSLSTVFFRNRYLLVLAVLVILIGGFSALSSMPRLEDPRITNRNPVIITLLPGASAERVEALVTEKLEEELQEVAEIKELDSTSRAGVSIIALELQDRVQVSEQIFSLIRDKLADAQQHLPPQASKPFFDDKRGAVAYTLVAGVSWTHATPPQLGILHRLGEELADQLRTIPGTEMVRLFGAPNEEVTIRVDPAELVALGLTPARVARSIAAADTKVPAGLLRSADVALLLEVTGELDSLERIAAIPLRAGSNKAELGSLVRLGDIAHLAREWRDPPHEIGLMDGRRAVFVAAKTQADRRVDQWAMHATQVVEQFARQVGTGVHIRTVFDQTTYTTERLSDLGGNLLAGAGVIVVVILLAMGWRSSLIVGFALPVTLALTLYWIALTGGALHQMSIFGMIIALGLLIDNAIVVVDEVRKNREAGKAAQDAVATATRHLFVPLFASTLTTVLAFTPILLLPGNLGDFVRAIGGSVILALIASFLVSMTIIPALAGLFLKPSRSDQRGWWQDGIRSERLTRLFAHSLLTGLRRPFSLILLACLLPTAGFVAATQLGSQFFPPVDRNMFDLQVWLPTESSITHTREQAQLIEAAIHEYPEVHRVDWLIGGSFPSVYYNQVMNKDEARHYAQAIITATSSESVKRLIPQLQRELDTRFPQIQGVVSQFAQGPPVEAEVELRLYGPSISTLQELGERVRHQLAEHPDVLHTHMTMARGEPKLWFDANEDKARLVGLTLADIAAQLQGSLEGKTGGSIVEELEEMPVRIRYADARRSRLSDIGSINLVSPHNGTTEWIPLTALGSLRLRPELGGLTRYNGIRCNTIQGYTRNGALPIDVTNVVLTQLEENGFRLPAGYRLEIGGDAEQERQAISNLMISLPVLLTLMVATLVLSFQSVRLASLLGMVAFVSIGLGLLATWAYGFPISFNTILGTAGLIGVALNDSIVVLAAIRANVQARAGDLQAIVDEVVGATRHVISTTFTTIGGFLPLLIFVGGDFWPPLAIVLAGGVGGATILALLLIPSAYVLLFARQTIYESPEEEDALATPSALPVLVRQTAEPSMS